MKHIIQENYFLETGTIIVTCREKEYYAHMLIQWVKNLSTKQIIMYAAIVIMAIYVVGYVNSIYADGFGLDYKSTTKGHSDPYGCK